MLAKKLRKVTAVFLSVVLAFSSMGIVNVFAGTVNSDFTVLNQGQKLSEKVGDSQTYVAVNKQITAKQNTTNQFDITLEVTTSAKTEIVNLPAKADVVLVVDTSGSMCNGDSVNGQHGSYGFLGGFYSDGTTCKDHGCAIEDAKTAATNFVNNFLSDNAGGNKRIALIEYANKSYEMSGFTANASTLTGEISKFVAGGTTATGDALKAATNLLKTSGTNTFKYIVLVTDGSPNVGGKVPNETGSGKKSLDAKPYAEYHAAAAKAAGADIYAIGCNTTGSDAADGSFATTLEPWLRDTIASSSSHYVGVKSGNLDITLNKIKTEITNAAQGWYVSDPMSDFVDFVSFDTGYNYYKNGTTTAAATLSSGSINWNLLQVNPLEQNTTSNGKENVYRLKYTIQAKDARSKAFYDAMAGTSTSNDVTTVDSTRGVFTNKTTTLHYYLSESGKVSTHTKNFDIPVISPKGGAVIRYSVGHYYGDPL